MQFYFLVESSAIEGRIDGFESEENKLMWVHHTVDKEVISTGIDDLGIDDLRSKS